MGRIYADIEPINPRDARLRPLKARAMFDSGAMTLCIPEPDVGPLQIRFENRNCFTGALVMGDAVLMGAVPMEDRDLVLNPRLEQVTVNPASPNIPTAVVKSAVPKNGPNH